MIGFDESAKIIQELVKQGIGPQQGKKLYLVDGNTGNALGEKLPAGTLLGVKGTLPGAEAPDSFRQPLLAIDPALKDFNYAGESYDAIVLTALAAVAAKSDAGTDDRQEARRGDPRRREVHHLQGLQRPARGRHGHRLRRDQRPDRVQPQG